MDMQLVRRAGPGRNLRHRHRRRPGRRDDDTVGSLGRRIGGRGPADWDPGSFGNYRTRTRRSFPGLGRNFLARKRSAYGRGPISSRSTRSIQSQPVWHRWHVSYPTIPFRSIISQVGLKVTVPFSPTMPDHGCAAVPDGARENRDSPYGIVIGWIIRRIQKIGKTVVFGRIGINSSARHICMRGVK